MTRTNNASPDLCAEVALAAQYDAAGNRTQLSATVGGTADFVNGYSYDKLNRMSQVTQSGVTGGNGVADKRVDFAYSADGQFSAITRYADLAGTLLVATGTYGYDSAGRLNSLAYTQGATTLAAYQWQYDLAGNLTEARSSADAVAGQQWGVVDYGYDPTNQLTAATYTNFANAPANESYAYGSNGNRTSANGQSYTTGSDNQLSSDGTYTYSYDANGNETARWVASTSGESQPGANDTDITTYAWDYRNRLTTVTHYATYGAAADKTIAYAYDVFNRLTGETVTSGDGSWTNRASVYDGNQVVLQFDSSGSSGSPGALSASDLSHRYLWGAALDQLLADEQSLGDLLWSLTDNENTDRDLAIYTPGSGGGQGTTAIANHRVFNSFGQLTSQTNPATGQAAAVDCVFAHTGKFFDAASGLQYNRQRWYDPATGRWLSQDPSGFAAGDPNLYRYVANSPTNFTDPTGLHENPTDNDAPSQTEPTNAPGADDFGGDPGGGADFGDGDPDTPKEPGGDNSDFNGFGGGMSRGHGASGSWDDQSPSYAPSAPRNAIWVAEYGWHESINVGFPGTQVVSGRLHHKSLSQKDFFQVALIPSGDEAFVLDADLEC